MSKEFIDNLLSESTKSAFRKTDYSINPPIFFDTETCGLHGMMVLLQYALGDGEIKIHSVWTRKVKETLEIIEWMINHSGGLVGFNLTFDMFHLIKIYTIFKLLDPEWYPADHIEEIALKEKEGIKGLCLKAHKLCDLMLHARKGPFQETMDREDIRIKKIPTSLAWKLAAELEKRVPLSNILFANRKIKREHFEIEDIDVDGDIDPNFKNIVVRFNASTALKNLAIECLSAEVIFHDEISLASELYPNELGYAPFCTAMGKPGKWNGAWPEKIEYHIRHWSYSNKAKEYAIQDVDITRRLYHYFGSPPLGDDDSELAGMVAAVRWKGFPVNIAGMKALAVEAIKRAQAAPTDPRAARRWIEEVMGETEKLIMEGSTAKVVLEEISKFTEECIFQGEACVDPKCKHCQGQGKFPSEAAKRAAAVLEARKAGKEVELYEKLILAGRFHPSFKVIGTLSSRMSGTDGLNPQGIKRTTEVRSTFTLADQDEILCGGDFISFEVSIAEAVYNDPTLRQELLSGKKLHALLAMELFPGKTYEEIIKSEGTSHDMYDKGKRGVFLIIYGGEAPTMVEKGIADTLEIAENAIKRFIVKHPQIGVARQRIYEMFCSMRQPGGLGTKVEWHDPAPYIESKLGFKRYFTLENRIAKELFLLANDPPKEWRDVRIKVVRRDRQQTASGACQSALYGAAFGIQAGNLRAAANHEIQSFGAGITKNVQRKVWDIQPAGIHEWRVAPINIHDELLCATNPKDTEIVANVVKESVESFRKVVPLIKIGWKIGMKSWANKKD